MRLCPASIRLPASQERSVGRCSNLLLRVHSFGLHALCVAVVALGFGSPARVAAGPQQTPSASPGTPDQNARCELLQWRERVESDGSSTFTLDQKLLLKTAAAVTQYGQLAVPYTEGYGDVQFENIVIEKADGRTVEVRNAVVEDTTATGTRYKKLTIPGLEPGDRVSYRVATREKPLAPGHIFGQRKLHPAAGDPVQTYELDIPRSASIHVRLREGLGATWEEVAAPTDRLVRRLTVKIERPDPDWKKATKAMIRSWTEPDVMFTSFTSWSEVGLWWGAASRDRLAPDAAVKAEAAKLVASKATPSERIEALHGFVASKIRYVQVGLDAGRMLPQPAGAILANRYGDCKDKHAVLAALAASVGIDVRPVFINSYRSDLIDDAPSPLQFDHMISVARFGPNPAEWLWLDATNPFGPPGYLSPSLRGKPALLIEESGEGRIVRTPAEPPFTPREQMELKGTLQPNGALHARGVWRYRSDKEVWLRAGWAAITQDKRTQFVQAALLHAYEEGKVTNVSASEPLDTSEPFRVEFDLERPPRPPVNGEFNLWIPLPDFGLSATHPESTNREPIDLDVREFTARAEIDVPDGLSVRAPLSVSLERPFGKFESIYSVQAKQLRVSRAMTLSQRSISTDEGASYETFRKTIDTDRDQEFLVAGAPTLTAAATPATAVSPDTLHNDGLAAFNQKDYPKAVELLRKATEADPKVKDGFLDLGRALSEEGQNGEAQSAFSHQIENDPYHESAYAWRACVLERLGRPDEAEKDLLKQIEVAPFQAWSYQRLGERRTGEGRFHEAAEFLSRAAAVEPKVVGHWMDLAWSQARDGRPEEARAALVRARALDLSDWMMISAAGVYDLIGDMGTAVELAEGGLASVAKRLAALSPDEFSDSDLWGAEYLARAWHVIGAAATMAGDTTKGERYLDAAWKLWFLPEAAWALGDLREKQGRLAEAVTLWSMAADVPSARWSLPPDHQHRIEAASRRLAAAKPQTPDLPQPAVSSASTQVVAIAVPKGTPLFEGRRQFSELRTIAVAGDAITDLAEEVLLLLGPDGSAERIRDVSRKPSDAFERQLAKLGPVRVPLKAADDRPFKAVRRGVLVCSRVDSCTIVLDFPGLVRSVEAARYTEAFKVLRDAGEDKKDGRYQRALEKYEWFHSNALILDGFPSTAVFSSTVPQWLELGRVYPPALVALRNARDHALDSSRRDHDNVEKRFALFVAVNQALGDDARTVESFSQLDKQNPDTARRLYKAACPALIKAKQYGLCGKYLTPREDLAKAVEAYRRDVGIAEQGKAEAKKWLKEAAGFRFTIEMTTVVALLVLSDRQQEAKDIAEAAKGECGDPAFRAAMERALKGIFPYPGP
jgi:tetratricopeptide (TPR) repeat protein/transglutaminase-like putative cysteine protease